MEFPDIVGIQVGHFLSIAGSFAWNEVFHLGQLIHYNQDCITSMAWWEVCDEVHANVLPGSFRDRQRAQDALMGFSRWCNMAAYVIVLGPLLNILIHSRPVVFSGQEFVGFGLARVSCSWFIMALSQ